MATRNVKRTTTTVRKATTKPKRRQNSVSKRKTSNSRGHSNILNFVVPLVFIIGILVGLGFLLFKGYQTVTASSFFDVKKVEVRGTVRVPKDEVEKIVRQRTERDGVWNAELEQIKTDVEKLTFVKSVVVSRILPDGVLVKIEERNARAVVKLKAGEFWVDDDASISAAVGKNEKTNHILNGWEESDDKKAIKNNQERVKIFLKAQEEWKNLDVLKRVKSINISDLQDVQVTVEDSNQIVSVKLGNEELGKRLQKALSVIEGKGQTIEELISRGGYVNATPRTANLVSQQ